jgi:hypothetical protein
MAILQEVFEPADQAVFSGKAVFGSERTDHANAIIDGTGLRIDHSRRRGRGAGINPSGRF